MKLKVFIVLLSFIALGFSQSITGEANILEFSNNKLIYKGNVKLIRGSSVLKADEVIIILDKDSKPVKIIAKGKVKVIEDSRKSYADYVEYDIKKDVIYMKGNAKIVEGSRILEADEIFLYRKENRLTAKGITKRVRTVYVEEEK